MAVVATALVKDARSKRVAGVTNGELASYVKWPRDLRTTSFSPCVTATEAAGKAWSAIAFSRTEKAEEKRSS
jgi:hypothetical protein